ncbi:MAG: AAA family ATPase [Chloroflexi bacterium]|nr:AAA family ATPase [Chloroflexota bacterium]
MERKITDDLEALLDSLPPHIQDPLRHLTPQERGELLEVVLDLGRPPEARFTDRDHILHSRETRGDDIDYVVSRISAFGGDNRSGIERTLHRISAIRSRDGRIVGLSCRVGRAVYGTIHVIEDLVFSGKSLLLLGKPGAGKTTMLREVARVLSDDQRKRVVIVDTSNEIAGDGDIPHPAIGRARRMQVATPALQHAVMIEAVENHMPEVIIIDEIGTELEALAARTIAERGVQLVATAHGNTLENLFMNPTLCDLVGGIQSVTLSDEEAHRRGTQKSILERKAPPTFEIVVEIQSWDQVAVHRSVGEVVDSILRGEAPEPEVRWVDEHGEVHKEESRQRAPAREAARVTGRGVPRIHSFGVDRSRLERVAHDMEAPVSLVDDVRDADVVMTVKGHYRRRPSVIQQAEGAGIPIYVLRSNTEAQIQQSLARITHRPVPPSSVAEAVQEAQDAVEKVRSGQWSVELTPQNAYVRRLQHQLAGRFGMDSESTGREPFRRVKIRSSRAQP